MILDLTESEHQLLRKVIRDVASGRFNVDPTDRQPPPRAPVETWIGYTISGMTGVSGVFPGVGAVDVWNYYPLSGAMHRQSGLTLQCANLYGPIPPQSWCILCRETIYGTFFVNCVCPTQPTSGVCCEVVTSVYCSGSSVGYTSTFLSFNGYVNDSDCTGGYAPMS